MVKCRLTLHQSSEVQALEQRSPCALDIANESRFLQVVRVDLLRPLGDVIPIPPPAGIVLSVGDLLLYAGIAWFVVQVMRGRSRENPRPIAMWFPGYRGKHAPGHWRLPPRYRTAAPVAAERSGTEP